MSEDAKTSAGRAGLSEIRSGMTLGLGTGSTVRHFIDALGRALGDGELEGIRGVPTSEATAVQAERVGIPLLALDEAGELDLAVDGADEVDPALDLVKGLGGALLREKMVVQAARRFVVVVDESKRVPRLGARAPLPVEIVPFGWKAHLPFFRELGAAPELRGSPDEPYLTDNGNYIVDLAFGGGMPDPDSLERTLRERAGVVATGLFLGVADRVLVGRSGGVDVLDREGA